ncbi:hypothetical protein [Runella sp. SP2]|uniref:hypothetical protein n=1 Tax=Runella sp. SP2 TaxID=2268026 RepID=UPI000F099F54|nr:hypothetical protein [Runella sp. SP2]AYQ31376.1 hypothetical protein DTQ70_03925 [Runella sp. SP2]
MTLQERLSALALVLAGNDKLSFERIGNLATLNTTTKTSLVAAINEVLTAIGSATQINDTIISSTKTYSSQKIEALIDADVAAAVNSILGGASAAYDTLLEIQNLLQGQDNSLTNLLTAVANRVRFDTAQALTAAQKTQVCANIGVGEPDTDFVAIYNAALA